MTAEPVVVVDDLRYRYPGQAALALDGVSFAAEQGQFVGILGANGSGKSTLCHALVGLVPHFYKGDIGGRVTVVGLDVQQTTVATASRHVGLVFQNPFTQITGAKLTVYEEVAFGLEYAGVPRKIMVQRIDDALRRLGLWGLRDRNPYALSGGQMQRLAIASVLAMQPDVLVLDEPTSQLDPAGTREVFDAVAQLCRDGMTVVMAEHKVAWLAERADRILVLNEGRVADWDGPKTVLGRAAAARAESDFWVPVPAVTDVAVALQWRLPDGAYPVTLSAATELGREWLGSKTTGNDPDPDTHPEAEFRSDGVRARDHDLDAQHGDATDPDRAGDATDTGLGKPIVRVHDLHFHYTPGTPVLKGISLDIRPGTTAVVGQNGAGKSTFVRLLNGLLKPSRGDVTIGGVNSRTATVATLARTIGLVFQNPSDQLFKSKVLDEVMFGPLNLGVAPDEAEQRARHALERVGLTGATARNPYDLGLADRKLVTVAGVLAMNTDVIILDEPTIAQDAAGVARLGALVEMLQAEGHTVITITHDMDFVARYFERVLVFFDGQVLADGSASEVFSRFDVLAKAALEAPQITHLGHRLGLGIVLTTEELVRRLSPA